MSDKVKLVSADRLIESELRQAIGACRIGCEILVLEETTSTNDAILQRASVSQEGLTVFAEKQTAGRGQRENAWESVAYKGLWFSLLLRPKIELVESARLTRWSAQTVAQTIASEFQVVPTIKEPNDIHIAGKKVAGVLVEMRAQKKEPHFAIVGVGINVSHSSEDFSPALRPRATSLAQILNRSIDRSALAVALLRSLDRSYTELFST